MENSRIEQIKAFLSQTPNDAFLNYALAIEYLGQQKEEGAKEIFEKLIHHHPNYTATYYQLGKLYLKEGERLKAQQILESGLQIAVQAKEIHTAAELRTALNEILYDED